jgi:type VI protein secretion system component Hcp
MALDMFLNIKGAAGESRNKAHGKEIDVLAWSWGVSNNGSTHVGGAGADGEKKYCVAAAGGRVVQDAWGTGGAAH